MVKKQLPQKIIEEVAEYKKILQEDNLSLFNMYVFGSYRKRHSTEWQ